MKYFYIVLLVITNCLSGQESQHFIIPEPVNYEAANSDFVFDQKVSLNIQTNDEMVKKYAYQFQEFIITKGIKLAINQENNHKVIDVTLYQSPELELGNEGYILEIGENRISLAANEAAGIFNGFQTIRQLLPQQIEVSKSGANSQLIIMGCKIKDYPRFGWRGIMLDVSRHFYTVEEVKTFIDKMSQYKFNVLHWHLTDDQGWRIEIKSLPKLTEVGAWRVERYGRFGKSRKEPQPEEKATYGGYYTEDDIKDIVKFASDRNITIVPEIDLPGHSMAILAAYPELCTKKEPKFVNPGSPFVDWHAEGGFKMLVENMLNPADENVYDFADKVFTKIAELFPGEYIHMGGDECYKGYWEADSSVRKFMEINNLKDGKALQNYFVERIDEIIRSKGKKMIGWDEILNEELTQEAAVMSWRGVKPGIKASNMGYKVVMTPNTYAYLDYTQGDYSVENKIYRDLSLETTYSFDPAPNGVNPKLILGGQGNLWTEEIPTLQFAFYMAYPRAFALAESFWSPNEKKDWSSFIKRTENHFTRFDAENINISKAVFEPIVSVYKEEDKLMCKLSNSIPNSEIYFTINNTYPVQFGTKYIQPFEIPEGNLELRTKTFRDGKPLGRELIIHRTDLEARLVE